MQSYLQKHSFYDSLIDELPPEELSVIVIIPSYDEPELIHTLESLLRCENNNGIVEIIPVLNCPESASAAIKDLHSKQYNEIKMISMNCESASIKVKAVKPIEFPDKIAGVGSARKLGMDEAVRRFEALSKDGIILNIDADCICHPRYFIEVNESFTANPGINALTIGFSHRWHPTDDDERNAIILYEMHLRSYIGWQKFYQYPFAYQTLGSCFAVRSKAYQSQGGMNKRKAGEDFYFLHKFSILGELGELNKILIYPSGRISHRVPFGTGKGVNDIIRLKKEIKTYNPEGIKSFCEFMFRIAEGNDHSILKQWAVSNALDHSLYRFLLENNFDQALALALENSSTALNFKRRISKWFDPFRLMKYLHFAREFEYPDISIVESAHHLLELSDIKIGNTQLSHEDLLKKLTSQAYPDSKSE